MCELNGSASSKPSQPGFTDSVTQPSSWRQEWSPGLSGHWAPHGQDPEAGNQGMHGWGKGRGTERTATFTQALRKTVIQGTWSILGEEKAELRRDLFSTLTI